MVEVTSEFVYFIKLSQKEVDDLCKEIDDINEKFPNLKNLAKSIESIKDDY